jgi:DNA-binding NarL/FixJ family response regulator
MPRGFDYEWQRLELRFEQLGQHLDRLDDSALPHVINHFASIASLLRRKRDERARQARQTRTARAALAALPAYPDTPSGHAARRAAERKQRAIEIMRLAGRGWSNQRIGGRVGLSEGQVSRIVQQQLKLTRTPP